jgi:hypothetical protein
VPSDLILKTYEKKGFCALFRKIDYADFKLKDIDLIFTKY